MSFSTLLKILVEESSRPRFIGAQPKGCDYLKVNVASYDSSDSSGWALIDAQNIIINGTLSANGAGYFGGAGPGVVITLG